MPGTTARRGRSCELVVDYWPNNYMALYHAGMSEYALGQPGFRPLASPDVPDSVPPGRRLAAEQRWTCCSGFLERRRRGRESTYLPSGAVLQDRYEIVREIGRGGYSVVYLARDRARGDDVAIKLLVPPPAAARLARERLRREVQAVRRLTPLQRRDGLRLSRMMGPGRFVVLEYVAGPDLRSGCASAACSIPMLPHGSAGTWRPRSRPPTGAAFCIAT